ncbi:DUF1203 domain-containing protein [Streptomyces beihaiensis]|uniref:DUF1203 domain-containing protein n=1 Tax=Streptomyces beihaiensis TaxID=2984495 RepID=A0ABT3TQ72_9ACTN|nr:DUF1203 domain-containing protein [Streptomyces beihaiensis]MCX3059156.1 DUF1203 domain-containing protein [Streptomyces beihaiensis]
MTAYTARPIDATALKELRTTDDAGRPCAPYTATGTDAGSPLRCCLRPVEPGERIALVTYAPLRRWAAATGATPGAYDEQGPVFIHPGDCGGPAPDRDIGVYPFARPGARRTVRRYDARGHIVGGALLELPEDTTAAFDTALDAAFADPAVELVHVRALEYGCLLFEVRRPERG